MSAKAGVGDAAFGEVVGGNSRRHTVALGEFEDVPRGIENFGRSGLGPLEVEASDLIGDLDDSTGVHHIVGGVEDPALVEQLLHAGMFQLVVRTAADDLGA